MLNDQSSYNDLNMNGVSMQRRQGYPKFIRIWGLGLEWTLGF